MLVVTVLGYDVFKKAVNNVFRLFLSLHLLINKVLIYPKTEHKEQVMPSP